MASMACPHGCGVTFDLAQALTTLNNVVPLEDGRVWQTATWRCPSCGGLTVDVLKREQAGKMPPNKGTILEQHRAWPRSSRKAPPEVPVALRQDYEEAAAVIDDSPRAAAALARRGLQHTLTTHLGATGRGLEKQIESVKGTLPSYISEGLHALRNIGNFAAHPIKDKLTGDIVDVEPGEAEWTLDQLTALFDFTFVIPEREKARKAALNAKLKSAGKPELT